MAADSILHLLRCPTCAEPIRRCDDGWICSGCEAHGVLDTGGVLHLDPRPDHHLRHHSRYNSQFQPHRYGFAALGATYEGTLSLVFPNGWGTLARVIAHFGGQVVGMDPAHVKSLVSSLLNGDGQQHFLRSRSRLPFPFHDNTFDNVFLSDPTTLRGGAVGMDGRIDDLWSELFCECHRILKPGGRIVLSTPNRRSLRRHPSNSLPPLIEREESEEKKEGVRWYPLSKREYDRRLRRSGMKDIEYFIPWSDGSNATHIIRGDTPAQADLFHLRGSSPKEKAGRFVFRVLSRLGIADHFVPTFYIVAKKSTKGGAGANVTPLSTLETIACDLGHEPREIRTIGSHPNSRSLSFSSRGKFVKIPLTSYTTERLASAAQRVAGIPNSIRRDDAFILPITFHRVSGIGYVVAPHLAYTQSREWDTRVAQLKYALTRMAADARALPLGQTDSWNRLFSAESQAELMALGAENLLAYFAQHAATKRVPAGLVHGDLAYGNLVEDERGAIVLIDWDRCERNSPKFLDAVHACCSLARGYHQRLAPGRRGNGTLIAWRMVLERDPALPTLPFVHSAAGQLTWGEIISFALLDQVERRLCPTRSDPAARRIAEPLLREQVALAEHALFSSATRLPHFRW